MDINDLRIFMTITCFLVFMVIVGWAYDKGNGKKFEEAANLPFEDDDETEGVRSKTLGNGQGNAT